MKLGRLWYGLFVFLVCLTSWASGEITTNLTVYWPMDDGTGSTVTDQSGNGNTAVTGNGVAWVTDCAVGGCLSFDGVDDYVAQFTCPTILTGTVTVWVNPLTVVSGTSQDVVSSNGDPFTIRLEHDTTLHVAFIVRRATTLDYLSAYSTTPVTAGAWTHLAGTYDGTNVRLYVNGVEANNSPVAASGTFAPCAWLVVGINGTGAVNDVHGRIDEVRLYAGRTLTATEVLEDMAHGRRKKRAAS